MNKKMDVERLQSFSIRSAQVSSFFKILMNF